MGKKYQRRVSGLVRSHLTTLLQRKASDPRLQMVTITEVSVTPDTRYADVHYSILGGPEEQAEVQAGLENAAGWFGGNWAVACGCNTHRPSNSTTTLP